MSFLPDKANKTHIQIWRLERKEKNQIKGLWNLEIKLHRSHGPVTYSRSCNFFFQLPFFLPFYVFEGGMREKKLSKCPRKIHDAPCLLLRSTRAGKGKSPAVALLRPRQGGITPPGCANSSPLLGVIRSQMDHLTLQQESWTVPLPPVPAWGTGGCGWLGALQPGAHAHDRDMQPSFALSFLSRDGSTRMNEKIIEGPAFAAGRGSSAALRGSRSREQAGRTGEGDAFSMKRLSSCPKPAQGTIPGTSV